MGYLKTIINYGNVTVLSSITLLLITMIEEILFLIGRLLFGLVLAFMGLNHFMQTEQMTGYAEFKGVPAPKLAVLGSGALLVLGGLSIALGVLPLVGVILLAIFFIVTTPKMHDFWNQEGEDQQNEMIQFLKNTIILGAVFIIGYLSLAIEDLPLTL